MSRKIAKRLVSMLLCILLLFGTVGICSEGATEQSIIQAESLHCSNASEQKPIPQGSEWPSSGTLDECPYCKATLQKGESLFNHYSICPEVKRNLGSTVYVLTYSRATKDGECYNVPLPAAAYGSCFIDSQKPNCPGYAFLGWAKKMNSLTADYQPGDRIVINENTTLFSVWGLKGDTDKSGKVDAADLQNIRYHTSGARLLTGDAYKLADYNEDGTVNTLDLNNINFIINNSSDRNYTLVYNAYGGVNAPPTQIGHGNIKLSNIVPTARGYSFLGWGHPIMPNTLYQPGETIGLYNDKVLYAMWKANGAVAHCPYCDKNLLDTETIASHYTICPSLNPSSAYTVTYVANGGSGCPASVTVKAGERTVLPTPTKTSKLVYNANGGSGAPSAQSVTRECRGWTTSSTSNSSNYKNGFNYKPTADITLYALYKTGVLTVSGTQPARSGYTFLGWSTSSTATTADYQPGDSIDLNDPVVTLYAVWAASAETVRIYVYVSGTGAGTVTGEGTYRVGERVTLTAAPAAGSKFIGWYSDYAIHILPDHDYKSATPISRSLSCTFTVSANKDDNPRYAIFESTQPSSLQIRNYQPSRTIDYGTTITFHVDAKNLPKDAYYLWKVNGEFVSDGSTQVGIGETFKYDPAAFGDLASATIEVEACHNAVLIARSEKETVRINDNLWLRIIDFLRVLFFISPPNKDQ